MRSKTIIVVLTSFILVHAGQATPQQQPEEQPRRDRGGVQDRGNQQRRGGQQGGGDPFLRSPQMAEGRTIDGWDSLSVHGTDGAPALLKDLVPQDGRLVIVNGCLSCPKFLISYSGVEAVARDYAKDDTTRFIYLYKTLAHPENNGYIQAFTLQERLAQATAANGRLKNAIPFFVDGMDNSALKALGNSPNSQVIVDSSGNILHSKGWSDGTALRKAMIAIAGPTETTTRVGELGLPSFKGVSRPEGNVVPRVRPTEALTALRLEPAKSSEPHFVKLRAEVGRAALSNSNQQPSQLYLGFHLDPVHEVHWNNLVDPIAWSVSAPEGVTVHTTSGSGPQVKAATDTDPREFLLTIKDWQDQGPLTVNVTYYACSNGGEDDAKAFCRKVKQTYTVHRERDRTAGMVQSRGRGIGGRGGDKGNRAQGQNGRADRFMRMMDTNLDGTISAEEAKGTPFERRFEMMDSNSDGKLDNAELEKMRERFRTSGGRRGGGRPQRPSPPL